MIDFLVTGGAGFIGSHLVEYLVGQNAKVRVLDNLSTGKYANIAPLMQRIDFIEGDIREAGTCRRACQDVAVVLHEAALPSVPKSIADPIPSHDVNINGTFAVLRKIYA